MLPFPLLPSGQGRLLSPHQTVVTQKLAVTKRLCLRLDLGDEARQKVLQHVAVLLRACFVANEHGDNLASREQSAELKRIKESSGQMHASDAGAGAGGGK